MYRLLVVEDQVNFYQDYLLRLFEKLLPMEEISVVHVPTLDTAAVALQEPWDFILMDYGLGPKIDFQGSPIKDGADLISFRRRAEETKKLPDAFILGTSSNEVGNRLMLIKGADRAILKIKVIEMAQIIKDRLLAKAKPLDPEVV